MAETTGTNQEKKKFAERLIELRKDRGFETQEAMAEQSPFTQQQISLWETGTYNARADKLIALSHYFDVTVDYLLGLSNDSKGRLRDLSEAELRQLLFEYITPDHAPEILQHVASFFEPKD